MLHESQTRAKGSLTWYHQSSRGPQSTQDCTASGRAQVKGANLLTYPRRKICIELFVFSLRLSLILQGLWCILSSLFINKTINLSISHTLHGEFLEARKKHFLVVTSEWMEFHIRRLPWSTKNCILIELDGSCRIRPYFLILASEREREWISLTYQLLWANSVSYRVWYGPVGSHEVPHGPMILQFD